MVRDKDWKLTLLLIAVIFPALLAPLLWLNFRYETAQLKNLQMTISNGTIKTDTIELSGYKITDSSGDSNGEMAVDDSGKSYYIHRIGQRKSICVLLSALEAVLITAGIYRAVNAYIRNRIKSKMAPIEELSITIAGILSGNSNSRDDKAVLKDIELIASGERSESNGLAEELSRLIESENGRREFTANVTHELKTPLTSINGYAEMIASGMTDEDTTRKFAEIILTEGNRLLKMINEILQLSKFDRIDRQKLNYEEFDLAELALGIADEMEVLAASELINLECEAESVTITADKKMISELLSNLISNSIKYNYIGGNVHIGISREDGMAVIRVVDDGIGIPKKDRERIFERFYVVDRTRGTHTGTGLGLALVKHIVMSHGGNVGFKSRMGRGTKFTVKLPLKPGEQPS